MPVGRDAHGRHGVDALPAGSARAERVDPDVLRIDLDIDLLGLGKHRDRRRRGVDAARLVAGTRWTRCTPLSYFRRLYTRSPSIDAMTSLTPPIPFRSATSRRGAIPAARRSGCTCETAPPRRARRFVAAGRPANLEQDVLLVVRISGTSRSFKSCSRASRRPCSVTSSSSASARISASPARASSCACSISPRTSLLPEPLDERLDLGERPGVLAVFGRVALHAGDRPAGSSAPCTDVRPL